MKRILSLTAVMALGIATAWANNPPAAGAGGDATATATATVNDNTHVTNTVTGGSVTDNSRTNNTNTNIVAPVANGGSVRDSGNSSNRNTNNNVNVAEGGKGGNANQRQGQRQGQVQGQQQSQSADNNGNAQSTTLNYEQVHQAPTVVAGDAYPTAPCRVAYTGAGSGLLGGGGVGFSREDKECTLRETARSFLNMGKPQMALLVMCSTKAAIKAFGTRDNCLAWGK